MDEPLPRDAVEALRSSLGAFLETAPDAMLVADAAGRILLANSQAERLFGYGAGGLPGMAVEDLVPARYRERHPGHRRSFHADPHVRSMGAGMELSGLRRDGTEFPVEISLSPLRTPEGTFVSSAIRDVSERREASRQLDEARRRAEEGSRMKSAFLAGVSHELRTPLNAVLGFAELLHDGKLGPVNPTQRDALKDVLDSGRHLLGIINDLLDIAKIEAGKVEIHVEPVSLPLLVEAVVDALRGQAEAAGIEVLVELDPDLDITRSDPGRIRQVLFNYLSNALKFTPPGGTVRVRTRPREEGGFRIEVEDTGRGIGTADRERLFVEFQQVGGTSKSRRAGAGLGLSLTRRVVEALKGRVGVESEPGRGSLFWAEIPAGEP